MNYVSTTNLAKKYNVSRDDLFDRFQTAGLIAKEGGKWVLTSLGADKGGQERLYTDGSKYIMWPESLHIDDVEGQQEGTAAIVTLTQLAQNLEISPQRLNLIFAELGWIEKNIKGWIVTEFGKKLGAAQFEHPQSGFLYVKWPIEISENTIVRTVVESLKAKEHTDQDRKKEEEEQEKINKFRNTMPGSYRTKDGHWVRSRAEVIIDDALYDYGLPHAYERKLPVEEDIYSDFYIPSKKVYIEFWGLENDKKYLARKKKKQKIYQKYDINLIELNDDHIKNLDDHLPRLLLKYDIKVF